MNTIRTLLVDDHVRFLEAAARFLREIPRIHLIETVATGSEAVAAAGRLRPDLVVMDLSMPHMDGIEATRRIKASPDAPKVLIVSLWNDPPHKARAQWARADGFVHKAYFARELLPALQALFPRHLAGAGSFGPGSPAHGVAGGDHANLLA